MPIIQTQITNFGSGTELSLPLTKNGGALRLDNTNNKKLDFSGVSFIDMNLLKKAWYRNKNITGVAMPNANSLWNIGSNALEYAFCECDNITSTGLNAGPGPIEVATEGLAYTFESCPNLVDAGVSSIRVLGTDSMKGTFADCRNLRVVNFNRLRVIYGSKALQFCFGGCTNLTDIYFPLEFQESVIDPATDPFYKMLNVCENVTVHFNKKSKDYVEIFDSSRDGFGGTNTTILYDLGGGSSSSSSDVPEVTEEPEEE